MNVARLCAAFAAGMLAVVLAFAGPAGPLPAGARGTPTPAPTAPPPEDPAVTAIAHREFVAWQIGSINKSRYDPGLAANVTEDKIKQVSGQLAALGTFQHSEFVGPDTRAADDAPSGMVVRGYTYRMVCSDGAVYLHLLLSDPDNKVAGIVFRDKLQDEADATPVPTPH